MGIFHNRPVMVVYQRVGSSQHRKPQVPLCKASKRAIEALSCNGLGWSMMISIVMWLPQACWMVTISWNIHRTKWMTGGTVLSQLSADGPQHCIAKNSPVVLQSTCNHFLVWWAAEIMRAWETEKTGHSFPRAFCFDMYLLYICKWFSSILF